MKEIGLFYAMNAAKTSHIAEKIREKLGHKEVEMIMIEKLGRMISRLMII